jgi:hypothetical protein
MSGRRQPCGYWKTATWAIVLASVAVMLSLAMPLMAACLVTGGLFVVVLGVRRKHSAAQRPSC